MAFTEKGKETIEAYENLILQYARTFEQFKRPSRQIQGHFTVSTLPSSFLYRFFEQIPVFCGINLSVTFTFYVCDEAPNLTAGDSAIDIHLLFKKRRCLYLSIPYYL